MEYQSESATIINTYGRRNGENQRVSIMQMGSVCRCYDSQGIRLPAWLALQHWNGISI
jgi:hypothetical protein